MQSDELKERVTLIRNETDALIVYLETLSDKEWSKQSACEEWTVADVIGHMIFVFKDVCFDGVSRGLKGDVSIPKGFPDPENLADETRHRIISDVAKMHRRDLGNQLLPTFKSNVEAVCQLWNTLTPDNWEAPCYRMAGIRPAYTFVTTPITETAMHHWDIRSHVSPESAYLSPESIPYFIRSISQGNFFNPGMRLERPFRFRFNLAGAESYTLDFMIAGDSVETERNSNIKPHGTFSCDEETLVLLIYGRLSAEESIKASRLSHNGEEELFGEFFKWYQ